MRFYPYNLPVLARYGNILCETFINARSALHLSAASVCALAMLAAAACGASGDSASSPTAALSATAPAATAAPSPVSSATPVATSTPVDTSEPAGFPLDPNMHADAVVGAMGSRVIEPGAGPTIADYTAHDQPSDDPVRANASGWNCRVHVEYEGAPAVDWYVPSGTPVYATMDGEATLIVNTLANAFDYYDVDREPYIGDPDRTRAPLSPFPGPGGGMGVYVAVINDRFRTDYGHLSIAPTLGVVPVDAFASPYSRAFDYASTFAAPQSFTYGVQVAGWSVRTGDVIGYTGDAGYSEAPHLHYTITDRATGMRLCPTGES